MQGSTIFFIVFFGMIFGVLFGIFIFKRVGNRQRKNAIGRINNQDMKHRVGGKEYNFIGEIDKDIKKRKADSGDRTQFGLFKFRKKKKDKEVNVKILSSQKEERRPTKKSKKKENKKHPYKKKISWVGKDPGKRKKRT